MGCEVIFSLDAETDLENIARYISRDKPDAAIKIGVEITMHFRVLENHPRPGRMVPEFGEETLREIIHGLYRLIYEVNDSAQRIEVIRIWHGGRGTPELRRD